MVDDEHRELSRVARMVRKSAPKAEIKELCSSQDALRYTKENEVDLAFLKMEMPKMDGIFLARHLREINPYMNLIFTAASADNNDDILDMWHLAASGLMVKPIDQAAVDRELKHLRQMLGGRILPTL